MTDFRLPPSPLPSAATAPCAAGSFDVAALVAVAVAVR